MRVVCTLNALERGGSRTAIAPLVANASVHRADHTVIPTPVLVAFARAEGTLDGVLRTTDAVHIRWPCAAVAAWIAPDPWVVAERAVIAVEVGVAGTLPERVLVCVHDAGVAVERRWTCTGA
jgi:hypothetical protein